MKGKCPVADVKPCPWLDRTASQIWVPPVANNREIPAEMTIPSCRLPDLPDLAPTTMISGVCWWIRLRVTANASYSLLRGPQLEISCLIRLDASRPRHIDSGSLVLCWKNVSASMRYMRSNVPSTARTLMVTDHVTASCQRHTANSQLRQLTSSDNRYTLSPCAFPSAPFRFPNTPPSSPSSVRPSFPNLRHDPAHSQRRPVHRRRSTTTMPADG